MNTFARRNEDVAECERIAIRHGKSYHFASRAFPRELREAVYVLYAFLRLPDEIVDTELPRGGDEAARALGRWHTEWIKAHETGESAEPVLRAAAWLFHTYAIPFDLGEVFFSAMESDTVTTRYETFDDLKTYMYGSAAVVGRMLSHIIGVSSPEAFAYAEDLGYAMQLTNFLRDIAEDYRDRGRIYLPQEDLRRFGVTEEMVAGGKVTPEFTALMRFEIERTRALYRNADKGIPLLHPQGRKAVRLARILYSKILDKIEDAEYNVFTKRHRTNTCEKVYHAIPVILGL